MRSPLLRAAALAVTRHCRARGLSLRVSWPQDGPARLWAGGWHSGGLGLRDDQLCYGFDAAWGAVPLSQPDGLEQVAAGILLAAARDRARHLVRGDHMNLLARAALRAAPQLRVELVRLHGGRLTVDGGRLNLIGEREARIEFDGRGGGGTLVIKRCDPRGWAFSTYLARRRLHEWRRAVAETARWAAGP